MTKKMICIVCPRGCALTVENGQEGVTVMGNACPKGKTYGEEELIAPKRTVTTVVKVANRTDTMVSVKTSSPVPKDKMLDVVKYCRTITVSAPVSVGDVVAEDIYGSRIVITKEIE
jgi:CxxC motif-containing protein